MEVDESRSDNDAAVKQDVIREKSVEVNHPAEREDEKLKDGVPSKIDVPENDCAAKHSIPNACDEQGSKPIKLEPTPTPNGDVRKDEETADEEEEEPSPLATAADGDAGKAVRSVKEESDSKELTEDSEAGTESKEEADTALNREKSGSEDAKDDTSTTTESKPTLNEDEKTTEEKQANDNEKEKEEEGAKDKPAKTEDGGSSNSTKEGDAAKEQTIIVTETKSLAQAINEAVKKPDGKPTLVIIETKSTSAPSVVTTASSNGVVSSSSSSSSSTSPSKSLIKGSPTTRSQTHSGAISGANSLRAALLHGISGMTTRSQTRPPPPVKTPATKSDSQGVALQDDSEVNVYTPSLLVPYLFECPSKESLSAFVKKIAPPKLPPAVTDVATVTADTTTTAVTAVAKVAAAVDGDKKTESPLLPQPPKPKTFFDLPLGQFFIDIGLTQVQKWVQSEILKAQKKKLDKGWRTNERVSMVNNLEKTLEEMNSKTDVYKFELKKCKRCNFVTESRIVLERHLETIHVNGTRMLCSFCDFETIDPSQIFHHLYTQHKAFGRLERPPTIHMCPLCPFEDTAKARVTRHSWKCVKNFVPEKNLAPPPDFEPPAKRTRHVATVATLKALRSSSEKDTPPSNALSFMHHLQSGTSLLSVPRGPHPIRPKPGDLRFPPTYVQSVLRGSYGSPPVLRTMTPPPVTPQVRTVSTPRPPPPVTHTSASAASALSTYLLPRSQPSAVTTSAPYTLQGNQLFQVVHTGSSTVVPIVRGTTTAFTPPRFTILPTPPATVNTRGPTPVALIPNLATTGQAGLGTVTSLASLGGATFTSALRTTTIATSMPSQASRPSAASQMLNKPNISITPVNKPTPAPTRPNIMSISSTTTTIAPKPAVVSAISTPPGYRPSQQGLAGQQAGANASYVVCEICDGYIKDLDQLRNHMQWIHKVKIHPKMIHNRPPLNCQKCHFRFFTDQGLERHLLGYHGLVTSSMQENANKGKDGGRCIICGKVFLWKLVVHMAKDHKMTLKPAHLSYKCTVCSATFNMYRLFETHVYEEHSTVAKRVLDGQKSYPPTASSTTATATSSTASAAAKSKVTITPSLTVTPSSSTKPLSSATIIRRTETSSTDSKKATPAPADTTAEVIALRSCVDCGKEFKLTNCIRHWEETHLKPCQVKLCRVDRCEKCTAKDSDTGKEAEKAPNGKTNELSGGVKRERAEVSSSSSGATVKKDDPEIEPTPSKKTKIEVEYSEKQENQSDGDDVFDMEVETVDEDQTSAGNTDVESD